VPIAQFEPSVPTLARHASSPSMPLPIAPDLALRELAVAADRNRIVELLLGYAASTFEAAVVFTVRDHLAFGWKAIGPLLGHAHVEHLLIPLEAPSVLRAGIGSETGIFHGSVSPSTVNSYFFKVMACTEPAHATVGVIQIGKRVVNIIYGHGSPMTPLQLDVLRQICQSAAAAYARLIASSKRGGGRA